MTRKADSIHLMHRQWTPRYQSRPYVPSPGRREFIHGPIQPMDEPEIVPEWAWWLGAVFLAPFVVVLIMGMPQ